MTRCGCFLAGPGSDLRRGLRPVSAGFSSLSLGHTLLRDGVSHGKGEAFPASQLPQLPSWPGGSSQASGLAAPPQDLGFSTESGHGAKGQSPSLPQRA